MDDRNKVQKIKYVSVIMLLLAVLVGNVYSQNKAQEKKILTVGWFSDSYWGVQNGYSYRILDDAIAKFEKEHLDVEVTYTSGVMKQDYSEWLSEGLISGKAPDVFLVLPEDFNDLVEVGALQNLEWSEKMDGDGYTSKQFFASAYDCGKYDTSQYALPFECSSKLMFVNLSILKEEGIAVPDDNWTWDDFYNICQRCTKDKDGDGNLDQFGYYDYDWQDAFESNGVQLYDDKGKKCNFSGEKVEEAIEFVEKLSNLNEGNSISEKQFDLGNVVFQPMSFSQFRAYKPYPLSVKKYSGFEWGCLAMPSGPSGDNVSSMDTLMVGMNKECDDLDLSWAFMKTLCCDEEIQNEIFDYSEGISVLRNVTQSNKSLNALFDEEGMDMNTLTDSIENGVVVHKFRNYDTINNEVDKAVRDILNSDTAISTNIIIQNRELNRSLSKE